MQIPCFSKPTKNILKKRNKTLNNTFAIIIREDNIKIAYSGLGARGEAMCCDAYPASLATLHDARPDPTRLVTNIFILLTLLFERFVPTIDLVVLGLKR